MCADSVSTAYILSAHMSVDTLSTHVIKAFQAQTYEYNLQLHVCKVKGGEESGDDAVLRPQLSISALELGNTVSLNLPCTTGSGACFTKSESRLNPLRYQLQSKTQQDNPNNFRGAVTCTCCTHMLSS